MAENVFELDIFDDDPKGTGQPQPEPRQKRRRFPSTDERPAKSRKRAFDLPLQRFLQYLAAPADRNPISVLNECRFDLVYATTSADGSGREPFFTITATVRGLEFRGSGRSKKQAKEEAARAAVEGLRIAIQSGQFPTTAEGSEDGEAEQAITAAEVTEPKQEAQNPPSPESTTVSTAVIGAYLTVPAVASVKTFLAVVERIRSLSITELDRLQDLLKQGMSPTDTVNLAQRIAALFLLPFVIEEKDRCSLDLPVELDVGDRHFAFQLRFVDTSFYAVSHAKKAAKQNVCAQFINWLLDILPIAWRSSHLQTSVSSADTKIESGLSTVELVEESSQWRTFASQMDLLVFRKLEEVYCKHAGTSQIEYVDLGSVAAVCLSQAGALTTIAVASGASVIYRKYLSARGRTLKDSQAEVLVLRATRRYLLQQAQSFLSGQESIFRGFSETGKLELKEDIGFHLFISHCPSGSCSTFKSSPAATRDSHTDRNTIMEDIKDLKISSVNTRFHFISGELASTSCYPVDGNVEYPPALADLTEGRAKLRVMSASDKILRRLVVGIQGSLASNFIHPVFLQNISIQAPERLSAMASGLYERILPEVMKEEGQKRCFEFPLVCPEICSDARDFPEASRFDLKSFKPTSAFAWLMGVGSDSATEEFINTTNGLLTSGKSSELTKKSFAVLFRQVLVEFQKKTKRFPEALKELAEMYTNSVVAYADLKAASVDYRAKSKFFLSVTRSLGQWMGKCPEEDEFVCGDKQHQEGPMEG